MWRILLGLLLALAPAIAFGQNVQPGFPSKPVRIIVPFPAGGGVDALGRIIQVALQERLGQPVIIENKPGAAGTIGVEFALSQPKDGHTVLIGAPGAISVAPSLNRTLPYDPARDLAAVTMGVRMPNLLVAAPTIKAATVS